MLLTNHEIGGCLVISRCGLPSAADEKWYSPKRPSSTVVIPSVRQRLCRGKSLLFTNGGTCWPPAISAADEQEAEGTPEGRPSVNSDGLK